MGMCCDWTWCSVQRVALATCEGGFKKLGRGHEAREFLDPMKQALSGTMPRSLVDGHLDPTQARHLAEVIET